MKQNINIDNMAIIEADIDEFNKRLKEIEKLEKTGKIKKAEYKKDK